MFGRDLVLPLNTLLEPKIRYMGNDINIISLETMKNLYEIVATNLKLAREKGDPPEQPLLPITTRRYCFSSEPYKMSF